MAEQEGHRWFAAIYDRLQRPAERSYMRPIREEIAGGATGRILEIGAGTGANFPYYSEDVEALIATEPDPFMLRRAEQRAQEMDRTIDIKRAPAHDLPFDDESFDTVVATLVLCSVPDGASALSEMRRVLKPEGKLRFYEHVRYEHPFGAFWQDIITPAWRWFGAGCHPNRDTARSIREAGFEIERLQRINPAPPVPPMVFVRPHIIGVAHRG
jgi:ubiquinone/menaquinone biosynthesis C-methylase UbiE